MTLSRLLIDRKNCTATALQTLHLVVFLLAFGFSCGGAAWAGTFYVDPAAGSDGGDGSTNRPWKTIARAAQAENNSTIYLRSGSYGAVGINGISSDRTSWGDAIVFKPQAGHTPVLESLVISGMPSCFLQFIGLDIQCTSGGSGTYGCRIVDASHVKITDCELTGRWHDTDKDQITMYGVWVVGSKADVSDVVIQGCSTTQFSIGMQLEGRIRTGAVLRGNTVHKNNSSLLRFATDSQNETILVEYNNAADYYGIEDPHGSGLSIRNSNMTIRGNVIRAYGGSGGIRFYQNAANNGAVVPGGYSNILCENNLIYGSPVSTAVFSPYIGENFTFRNNTVVSKWAGNSPSSGRWRYVGSVGFGKDPSGTGANVKIHNNVFVCMVNIDPSLVEAGVMEDHNIMWVFLSGKMNFRSTGLGPHSRVCFGSGFNAPFNDKYFETSGTFFVGGDSFESVFDKAASTPQVDSAFRLAPGSIAIDAGDALYGAPSCIEGLSRNVPDLGAYEFRSGGAVNHAPTLASIGNQQVSINELLSFSLSGGDPDGDDVTYSVAGLPAGASFSNGTFTWRPTANQIGGHQVTFTASDGQAQDSETIMIAVSQPNAAPVLSSIGNKSTNENQALTFSVSATDADGNALTYSATGLPGGASFSGHTFAWTPSFSQAGVYNVTFIASDGRSQDSETIAISVANVNRAPTLAAIGDRSVDEDHTLALTVSGSDPDGAGLTYSAAGLPSGATFSGQNFAWTPNADQAGAHQVTFAVSDGAMTDSETITVTVVSASADAVAPVVARQSPAAGAIQVPLNNLITLHVTDAGKGVNPASVQITLDGGIIYQGNTSLYTSAHGRCIRSGSQNDYEFTYQHDTLFDFDHEILLTVNAADLAGNAMSQATYSFSTEMRAFGSNKRVSRTSTAAKGGPVTVADAAGNIWAAWHAGPVGARDIYVARQSAGLDNFETPIQITTNSLDQCYPDLALAADGTLYVVWQDNRRGNWDIYSAVGSVDSRTFSKETAVVAADNNQTAPAVVVDGTSPGRVYVAWQDDRNGNQDIYLAHSTNAFSGSTVSRITTNTADQTEPDMAVGASNTVYLVWTDKRNGQADIYGAVSNASWANVALVTGDGNQTDPAVAVTPGTSALHLLWVDDATGDTDIYYASSDGLPASSLAGVNLIDDTSGAPQSAPAIACDAAGKVFACWQDNRNMGTYGSDTDIYFTELSDGAIRTNILVGEGGAKGRQTEPAIALSTDSQPYVVWTDYRSMSNEIYSAATTCLASTPLYAAVINSAAQATIGVAPTAITRASDVSVVVPAGACQSNIRVAISKILNPVVAPIDCLGSYDFGPSGIEFNQPVTVTIPYQVTNAARRARAYWYNSLTGALSQQGITNIENIMISSNLYALRFKTTHFTPYYLVASDADIATSGGGGGGCSMSATGGESPSQVLIPFGMIVIIMAILRQRDRRNARMRSDN